MTFLDSDIWALCITPLASARPLWADWSLAPQLLLPFLAGLAFYTIGSRGRTRRSLGFGGWAVLGLALFSPLCRLAADLVSAHMIQLALMSIVAPAMMAGARVASAIKAGAENVMNFHDVTANKTAPISLVAFFYGAAIWLWHVPPIYNATLVSPATHLGVIFAIVLLSIWFFHRALAGPTSESGAIILALLVTMTHTGLLGAILTFAPQTLYATNPATLIIWGLTASSDQQLAGLIMWAPSGLLFLIVALIVTAKLIGTPGGVRAAE